MGNDEVKIFKDSVHGYIEIPSVIVSNIIDTEQFQRLRFIEQTSMRPLYPSARHDRFIHSLGVYYLGKKVFAGFMANCNDVIESLIARIPSYDFGEITKKGWWEKQQLLFEIACLMHDCAHAPFSHTLEDYYYYKQDSEGTPKLRELLEKECAELDDSFKSDFESLGVINGIGAAHEKLSSFIILREYRERIKKVFESLLPDATLAGEDFAFICRMIIGCRYRQVEDITHSLQNCIVSLLNSSTIDVDGLDYIVRDAQMSGASTFNIDYQRIINSFTILPTIKFNNIPLSKQDISGIWLKGSQFQISNFTGSITGKIGLNDCKNITTPPTEIVKTFDKTEVTESFSSKVEFKATKEGKVTLTSSAKVRSSKAFSGIVNGSKIVNSADDLQGKEVSFVLGYDKRCLSIIQNTIDARNNEYLWIYTHPKVQYNSHYLQCELLLGAARFLCYQQNKVKGIKCNCDNCFECNADVQVKDDKSSREGKPPFYEDYILQILGYKELFDDRDEEIRKGLSEQGYFFYRSNDDDLNALFKHVYLRIGSIDGANCFKSFQRVYEEYTSRKQRRNIWKSFMEKEVFDDLIQGENVELNGINELIDNTRKELQAKRKTYSKVSFEEQKIFDDHGLKNVLIILANAKTKKIDFPEFFVKYGETSARLCDIFDSNMITNSIQKNIEYIFYEGDKIENHHFVEISEKLSKLYEEERDKKLRESNEKV